jgi:hypothetical protein
MPGDGVQAHDLKKIQFSPLLRVNHEKSPLKGF